MNYPSQGHGATEFDWQREWGTIHMNSFADGLNGGSGTDSFVFNSTTEGVDIIEDFSLGFERINLARIFSATGSVVTAANLSQFVQATPAGAGADSFLGVDANGAVGGLTFTIIAQVNAVTAAQLFDIDNYFV